MLSFVTEKQSCWDRLKADKRPIFIYGMGDGALKIMSVFREKGITVSGVFASDDFVRGHSFEGYHVHRLSEIEEMVDDFVVVLAFAAGYQEIVDKIQNIASKHTLYVPDVPVAVCSLTSSVLKMPRKSVRSTTVLRTIIHVKFTLILSISK